MQNPGASSHISNNGCRSTLPNSSFYCSASNLSDTGSWDTDFDDDQNSESSGFYGDVGPAIAEKPTQETQSKSSGVGRVAALAKTVAASLAASGHSGSSKFQNRPKRNELTTSEANILDLPGNRATQRPTDRPPVKPLPKPFPKPVLSSIKPIAASTLPKPPGPESEQVQQVIGALGHMWSSDSISLSSQTQSDDDYEPMQSDSSPQMPRLSPHPFMNGSRNDDSISAHHTYANDNVIPRPDTHSSPVQSYLHSTSRTSEHSLTSSANLRNPSQTVSQSTPFLHSPAASAAASRLSQCSMRSSGCDSVYSPSSGSSIPELQHEQSTDGVYEPIEEKQKNHSQKSFLHSMHSIEKGDVKRPPLIVKTQSDQRPPVPNRPLPPTPQPEAVKICVAEPTRGALLPANLEHQPWFHNVDRKQAEELIKNGVDGYFLIRPSSQSQNPLTLTLWYNQRVYNISVRQRKDGRIALGFEKPDEQSFLSIEEMIVNYQSENLLLFSRNERTGRTVLTKSPPKQNN